MTPDDRNTLIDAISKESDGGSSPTDVMSSATVPNDSASLKQHAASGQRVNPASIKTTSSMQAWAAAVQAETKVRRLLDDNARQDESQAKATEGKAGNAEGTPLVRQTTTGTGLRVGAADAVQPATSEFMDVTAGETAPSSDYDHGYADGVEWATKKYAPGTSDSAPNHQPHAVSRAYGVIDPDYARIFTIARCLAWAEGYALAMHGSFTRDLDLIAVPWAARACDPEHLAKRIESAAGLKITVPPKNDKPHNRLVWTMTFPEFGDPRFVDLSIIPPQHEVELSEEDVRMIDQAWETHKAALPLTAQALAEEIHIQMSVNKTCVVSGANALAKALLEKFKITQLTKTPSADHDDGNLRSLAEPKHQPHAVSQAAAFVAWAMREGPWEGGDLDGGALQDKAEELGLIIKTTYNPDIHGSCDYGSEPGDDWFVLHPDIEAAARLPAPPSPAKTGGAE